MIFLIGLLIAAEGMGFSFMLGTFIAPEGTADTYLMLMLGIVFTLCVILGINMHAAGQQLYKRQLIVNCRRDWQETSSGDNKPFKTREVSLNTDQRIDDDDPFYTQVVNRVGTHSSLWMVYVAIFAIIVIAGGSTYMRAKGLEKSRADETLGKTAATTNSTAGNPFASKSPDGFPADVVAANDKAAAKGLAESRDAGTAEAYTAFVILAVIFVITQIVAIYSGAKWGFAAKESESAFKSTRGYASWTQVEEIRSRYIEPVEELMGALHAKYQGGNRKMTSHTVRQFLEVPTSSEAGDNSQVAQSLVYRSASNDAPVNKTTESTFAIETHLKAIAALLAIEEKQNYVLRLPSGIKEKVIDAIRARKEADAKAKEVKDLENLF